MTVSFSVIIPSFNRPARLASCLQSFLHLDYPQDRWELIVVNDGGASTFSGLEPLLRERLPLRLIDAPHGGPARARNFGAKIAQGDYLAFTDDDCTVEADWLTQFAAQISTCPSDGLSGQSLNGVPDNLAAATWQLYVDSFPSFYQDQHGNLILAMTNNVTWRREVFDHVGGFDEHFPLAGGEDLEFSYRLVGNGYTQSYCPQARVWHQHRATYAGYLAQQFRYGRGAYYVAQATQKASYTVPKRRETVSQSQMLLAELRRRKAPLPMWILVALSSPIHRLGKLYETFRQSSQRSGQS